MTVLSKIKVLLIILLFANTSIISQAKESVNLLHMDKYSRWSFIGGPVFFQKGKNYETFGPYAIKNKIIPGFNAGVEYQLLSEPHWSLNTGLTFRQEPLYKIEFTLLEQDLPDQYYEDETIKDKVNAIFSFSFPLFFSYLKNIDLKNHLQFSSGFQIKYFPHGEHETIHAIRNEDYSEIWEIFGIRVESPDNAWHGSVFGGIGLLHDTKWSQLGCRVSYVVNFQNEITGEYVFQNLLVSEDSYGKYKLSGNHLSILFSLKLKKSKKKLEELEGLIKSN